MSDYGAVLTDLKARREELVEEMASLNTAITAIERLTGRNTGAASAGLTVLSPLAGAKAPYAGMTMKQALTRFMEASGGAVRATREITTALQKGGYVTKANNPTNVVYNNLLEMSKREDAVIEKTGGGWRYRG